MANLLHLKGSRTQILKTLPSKDTGNDGDIVVSAIQGRGIYLCIKANNRWYVSNKLEELRKIEKTSIKDLKVNRLKVGNTTITKNECDIGTGDFSFLYTGSIGFYFSGNTFSSHQISADASYSYFRVREDGGTGGDLFTIAVAATGDTSLTTVNVSGTGGADISLDADGDILIDCDNAAAKGGVIEFSESGTIFAKLNTTLTSSQFFLYEAFGVTDDDFFRIACFANGATTIATVDDSGAVAHLTLDADGDIILDSVTGYTNFYIDGDTNDYAHIRVGLNGTTTLATFDDGGTVGHLSLVPDGDLILDPVSTKVIINATDGLYLDGGGDTYIAESSADVLDIKVGNDMIFQITESGDDGNTIDIDNACIGFTQLEPTYDATNTVVDFRHSNKQFVTFDGGSITNFQLFFPLVSGNFVLLVKQDGTGSRTITNYKVYEFDESTAAGSAAIKFAGGSNPTLTTDANHVDIISIYWDADNEIAYGVVTLDFQF